MSVEPMPVRDLVRHLRQVGVEDGDVVMVHASLRALGPVEDGAAGVVHALDTAVGSAGTLLMMIGARDDRAWVNELPEGERSGRLVNPAPFSSRTTPADPEVGVLAEVFRQYPGSVVSDHPEGRFAARGRLADQFVRDVPWDDYYGPGSPLQRLVDARGKVLRLGADTNTVTLIHYAEYLSAVANKRRVRRHRLVMGSGGPEVRTVECLDNSNGIVDCLDQDYFATILLEYFEAHNAQRETIGKARAELIDADELVRFASRWMSENLPPEAD